MRIITLWVMLIVFQAAGAWAESEWFPFQPKEDGAASVIDTSSWLDAPAGKHGFVKIKGKDFVFADGTPVKFWGSNICNARPGYDNAATRRWARKLAKFGINCIRFHKFTYAGRGGLGAGGDSTKLDPNKPNAVRPGRVG